MSEKRTEIGSLGEFGLIDHLLKKASAKNTKTIHGPGDDAAVISNGEGNLIVSSDMLTEGIHFDLSYTPLMHLGYKAVAVNVSDIAAMNGTPRHILINLGVSNRFSVEALEVFYSGVYAACEDYNIDVIGGDTTSSASGLIISITVIGEVTAEQKTLRSGAKVGDILCVSGDLGGAYLGLQVLEREKEVFKSNPEMQPKLEGYDYIIQRQLKPKARMDVVHELRESGILPSSMIDISDGLASEILHLSKASQVAFRIYEENLPIDPTSYNTALEFKIDSASCMLNGGEDYELLFTIDKNDKDKIEKMDDVHMIGYVQPLSKGNELISKNQNVVPITAQGFKHFL